MMSQLVIFPKRNPSESNIIYEVQTHAVVFSSVSCCAARPSKQGEGSKHQIWNTFGWIYDTSVAMVHIALAGVFRRYPGVTLAAANASAMYGDFVRT